MNFTSINSGTGSVFNNIQNGIESEQAEKIRSAMIAVTKCIESLCENIEDYGIDQNSEEGQKALQEIAEIAAGKDGISVSRNIQKFGIKSEEARIKIAKIAASQYAYVRGVCENIENYEINHDTKEGQKALEEIAEIAAGKDGGCLSAYIQKFGIKSKEARIKIARIAAGTHGNGTSKYIKNYEIDSNTKEGQKVLIEIAKISAARNGEGTSEHIKNYEIDSDTKEGQRKLLEIAKIATVEDGWGTIIHIKNYGIAPQTKEGQKTLIDLAKIAAANDGVHIADYIKNYGIDFDAEEGQKALVEIVEIATMNGCATSENIQKFGVKSEETRIKIAMLAAAYNGENTSKFIKEYVIDANTKKGQKALIEIAKIAAANNGYGTSKFIKEYEIKSEKFRVKIAKISAASYGLGTSLFIKKYEIRSEKSLIKIAKIAATNSGSGTSESVKNYGIDANTKEGKQALFEIAKMAAANNGSGTLRYINNYEIDPTTKEDKKAFMEIAEIAIVNNAMGAPKIIIQNYGIDFETAEGKKTFTKIAKITLKQALIQLQTFTINEFNKFSKVLEMFFDLNKESLFLRLFESNYSQDQIFDNFMELCKQQLKLSRESANTFTTWLNESYASIKDDHDKQKFLEWITVLTIFFSVSDKTAQMMNNINLLNSIRKTPPWLKNLLSKELGFYLDFNDKKNNLLQMFRDRCRLVKNEKSEEIKKLKTPPIHTEIISLIFAGYPVEAQEACLSAIEKVKGEREFFRRENNKKILLEVLVKIKNCPINPNAKKCVIEQLFHLDGKERLDACKLIRNLINFKELAYLHYLEKNEPTENGLIKDLENTLSDFFKKIFQSTVENFGEKYAQTFENWRSIDSLITFAGKMDSLVGPERDEPLGLLNELVTNVLNNDFITKRYETDNNPHMDLLKHEFSEVFEKWKNNLSLDPSEVVTDNKKEKISTTEAIKNQLLTGLGNEHLGEKKLYPHIEKFLSYSNLTLLESIEKELKSLNEKREASGDKKFSKGDVELRKRLLIEKSILELFTIDHDGSLKEKLKSLINKLPRNNVFRQTDLEACLKLLANDNFEVTGFKVIESDHPNNLLLMGTEVDGSCQSVNGSPSLNKCLLSYIVDPKNKLILIVGGQGEILARAVIRILFDKNNKPVLFLEDMYTSGSNSIYAPNLRKLALKKARDLGIPLVALDRNKGEQFRPFDSAVFAKEKPVTFEYVDALKEIEKGPYSISSVVEVLEET